MSNHENLLKFVQDHIIGDLWNPGTPDGSIPCDSATDQETQQLVKYTQMIKETKTAHDARRFLDQRRALLDQIRSRRQR